MVSGWFGKTDANYGVPTTGVCALVYGDAGDDGIAPTDAAPAIYQPRNETEDMAPGRPAPLPLLSGEVARRAGGVASPASPQGHHSRCPDGSGTRTP